MCLLLPCSEFTIPDVRDRIYWCINQLTSSTNSKKVNKKKTVAQAAQDNDKRV